MIEITVDETRIRVEGHAGFGPPGRDIVCAGVSALFQTLVWSIEDVTGDIIEYGFGEGNSFLKLEKCVSEECDLLIRSFFYWHQCDPANVSGFRPVYMDR